MAEQKTFGTRIGLIAATVGSAVGLGNVWRFPAEVQQGGGAAFLIIYIGCVVLLGLPVMLSEMALGRAGRTDVVDVFTRFSPRKPWWVAGGIALFASYLILCFYMVVAGWTLEYLWESVNGNLFAGVSSQSLESGFHAKMESFICSDFGPLTATYIMIVLNLGVLLMGVRKGIERAGNIMMPVLFVLLLIFVVVALQMPRAKEGLAYFLNPDWSQITPSTVIDALGQAFFSLSLGMGILITYAAYYPHQTNLGRTACTVAGLDLLVAFMMGIIIFPAVMSFGLEGDGLRGTTLVFVTLPEVFASMPAPQLWAILFFLLLLLAALTSTISVCLRPFRPEPHQSLPCGARALVHPLRALLPQLRLIGRHSALWPQHLRFPRHARHQHLPAPGLHAHLHLHRLESAAQPPARPAHQQRHHTPARVSRHPVDNTPCGAGSHPPHLAQQLPKLAKLAKIATIARKSKSAKAAPAALADCFSSLTLTGLCAL